MRFMAGFVVASVLWGGLGWAYVQGYLPLGDGDETETVDEVVDSGPAAPTTPRERKVKRVAAGDRSARSGPRRTGEATAGDDLRENDARHIDVAGGGEQQLTGSEIEAGFDSVFPKVRRCLVLVASDDPIVGKVVFGMRIAGSGAVTAVNLKGPAAITASEAGECMRTAAKSIRYRSFNGPEMLVHYPLTLQ